jgi:UDP-N-acetyl-D-galactosamine dehydrogenase
MNLLKDKRICIIGLGYVGLPLAVEFGKTYQTVGFDINKTRVEELINGNDRTLEIDSLSLKNVLGNGKFSVTSDVNKIRESNIYIVTVPTPTDKNNRPVLNPLIAASELIGSVLKKGDIVIYESTVYPGVTEDVCVPVLERVSTLKYNFEFFAGYSPERINPGDKERTVTNILKVTSGSTTEIAEVVDKLYQSIIKAGTHKASCIKVAEASKVIENSQRDINIAFVNELSKIFSLIGINTNEVLEAAGTKWNFLKFKPGLVGGHCIGVDPYYLAQRAQELGYYSEIILAGRRINDGMGIYITMEVVRLMIKKNVMINNANLLILGFTFKENCPDVRNTKVIDIYSECVKLGMNVTVADPWANPIEVNNEYQINTVKQIPSKQYDTIILAVAHDEFIELDIKKYLKGNGVIYDVKGIFDRNLIDGSL